MTRHARLGELEELTLLAVARLQDEAYGASVQRELEDRASRAVSIATVYVTLVRLDDKGMLESWESEPEPVRGGKAKRLYRLTEEGALALRESRAIMERMWEGLEENPDLSVDLP